MQAEGLHACVKHFPGHGSTSQDSHVELPFSAYDHQRLLDRDLIPYYAAIREGVSAVMTAHVVYPNAGDAQSPATFSDFWLQQVLRERMGFQGLIITDAIEMRGLLSCGNPAECGIRALRAGADILLYYKEAHQFRAFYELRRALERKEIGEQLVARKLRRVRLLKERLLQTRNVV
jgi:beta-N-acetylhexosaminidase